MTRFSKWEMLPVDLLEFIIRQLDLISYFSFISTCKSWQAVMINPKHYSVSHHIPWLMLGKHDDEIDAHSFFSLFHQKEFFLNMPGLRGKRCCGSSHGWLIAVDYQTLDLHLLNPFSKREINLASIEAFPYPYNTAVSYMGAKFIWKAILSKDPLLTDDYTLLVIFSEVRKLAFFRPKREGEWVVFDRCKGAFLDVIYFKQKIYAAEIGGPLMEVEIDPKPMMRRVAPCLKNHSPTSWRYLLEWCGDLLLVRRIHAYFDEPYIDSSDSEDDDLNWDGQPFSCTHSFDFPDYNVLQSEYDADNDGYGKNVSVIDKEFNFAYRTCKFKVYKLVDGSTDRYKWKKVDSINDCILFLGFNATIALRAADFPAYKGNQIYYTDDYWDVFSDDKGCHDIGKCDLASTTFETFFLNAYNSPKFPPIWIVPNP